MRDYVDEHDVVLGAATKEEIERDGLICRVAFVLLTDSQGDLILQQRSVNKRFYPLYWSGTAAGHMNAGETYELAGHRELQEEMGFDTDLRLAGTFLSLEDKEMVGVLVGQYDGPVSFEPMEVAQVDHFSIDFLRNSRPEGMKLTTFVERSLPLLSS